MMNKNILSLFAIALAGLSLICFKDVFGGEENGNCPDHSTYYFDGHLLPFTIIPCDYDCKTNHASTNGTCGDDYWNCLCQNLTTYVPPSTPPRLDNLVTGQCTYFNPGVNFTGVCQCAINLPFLAEGYRQICDFDCQCNHGAIGGTCNFDAKQCDCLYPPGFEWSDGSNGPATCEYQYYYNVTQAVQNLLAICSIPFLDLCDLN